MAFIDPFSLDPTGPFDYLLNYWLASVMRTIYFPNPAADERAELMLMVGEDVTVEVFDEVGVAFGDNISRAEIWHLPEGDLLAIRGSTSTVQVLFEILQSGYTESEPWDGLVSTYFGTRANQIWDKVKDSLADRWMVIGHSLGGALAGLMSARGAEVCWTIGQPREGNITYAESRDDTQKLRLFNYEDIVPQIPFDLSIDVNFIELLTTLPGFDQPLEGDYRHWGIPWRLTAGSARRVGNSQTTYDDAVVLLHQLIAGEVSSIFRNHLVDRYAERLRQRFPYIFPAAKVAPTVRWLYELDLVNYNLNRIESDIFDWSIIWHIRGGLDDLREGDAVWDEVGDWLEGRVYPFHCPGDVQ